MQVARAFSTVNSAEIAHFSRLSSQWWDERGEFSFLHQMNPARMQFIRSKLLEIARDEGNEHSDANVLHNLDILDVGCGGGLLSEASNQISKVQRHSHFLQSLARLGARTLGIDASDANIAIAKHHASLDTKLAHKLSYSACQAERLVNEAQRYDVVCSMEVLEHVDHPVQFLKTCSELLKVILLHSYLKFLILFCSHPVIFSFPPSHAHHCHISSPFLWQKKSCARSLLVHILTPNLSNLQSS